MANVPNQNEPPLTVKNVSTSISLAPVDNVGGKAFEYLALVNVAVLFPTPSCLRMTVTDLEIPAAGGLVNVKVTLLPSVISKMFDRERSMSYVVVAIDAVVTSSE